MFFWSSYPLTGCTLLDIFIQETKAKVNDDDDSEDMEIDDSYAESASQMDADGYYERNIFDDDGDESDVNASYDESSSKGHVGGPSGNDEHADGDECNFDIGYDEYQQDSLDWP